jgi:hypothetical protein
MRHRSPKDRAGMAYDILFANEIAAHLAALTAGQKVAVFTVCQGVPDQTCAARVVLPTCIAFIRSGTAAACEMTWKVAPVAIPR